MSRLSHAFPEDWEAAEDSLVWHLASGTLAPQGDVSVRDSAAQAGRGRTLSAPSTYTVSWTQGRFNNRHHDVIRTHLAESDLRRRLAEVRRKGGRWLRLTKQEGRR